MKYEKEVIKKIFDECNDIEQIKYHLFVYLKNYNLSSEDINDIIKIIPKENKYFEVRKAIISSIFYRSNFKTFLKQKEKLKDSYESYNNIIDSFNKLADELNIKNSLELSLLFSYTLYNGYFSFNKKHFYKIEDRLSISNFYAADIFNGGGVCLNYSDMLTDILNKRGYDAAIITNKINKVKRSYTPNLKTNIIKPKLITKIEGLIFRTISNIIGNHACTLIIDKNNPYIYDATNLTMFDCVSQKKATHTLGSGSIKLTPYFGMIVATNEQNINAFEKLCLYKDYNNPYSRKDFIITAECNYEKYDNNTSIFNSFNDSIMPSINNILKKVKK